MCFVLFLNTTYLFNWPVFLILLSLILYSYVSNTSVTKSSSVISQLFYSQELRSTNMQINSVCVCVCVTVRVEYLLFIKTLNMPNDSSERKAPVVNLYGCSISMHRMGSFC